MNLLRNIKVVGLRHQVSEMCELVSYQLHQLEMATNDQREATLVAKSAQWVYEDGSGGWVNFHPLINKVLTDHLLFNSSFHFRGLTVMVLSQQQIIEMRQCS